MLIKVCRRSRRPFCFCSVFCVLLLFFSHWLSDSITLSIFIRSLPNLVCRQKLTRGRRDNNLRVKGHRSRSPVHIRCKWAWSTISQSLSIRSFSYLSKQQSLVSTEKRMKFQRRRSKVKVCCTGSEDIRKITFPSFLNQSLSNLVGKQITTSEGALSNFRTVGQSVFLYESHMYSFANNDLR